MTHFAISCPPLSGHINPMSALARELEGRGHRITFLGFPDMRLRLADDLGFSSYGDDEWPPGSLEPHLQRVARLGGPFSLRRMILDLATFADTICRELPEALERVKPDFLIVDQTDSAGGLVATALGIPFVSIANALPMNIEPGVPPPVLPWPYDPGPKGIRRNRGGYRVVRFVERPITRVIRRHAARLGRRDIRFAHEAWSDLAQITQCVPGLDFPRRELPMNFHYVGPLRGPDLPLDFALPDDGLPLIFCSLGTLQGSRLAIFQAVAEVAAGLDARLLIAHCGMMAERDVATLPGAPLVRDFFPQRAVLSRATLAITHCGFNTVADALSFGVPMVGMPIAFEQPATAARLDRAGAAAVIYKRPDSKQIRNAIETVFANPGYRTSAAMLQREIASAGGVRRAADIIEQVSGVAPREAATTELAARGDARGDSQSESS